MTTRISHTLACVIVAGVALLAQPVHAQEASEEAPAEATSEEAPAEEASREAVEPPAEAAEREATEEAPAEEAPAEEAPAEEATPQQQFAELPPPPPPEDDLPIPTLTIDRVPPRTSFEFAVQVSYGTVAYFRDAVPPWIGFGFRGGWGKNFGLHRVGISGTLTAEGDVGVHTLLGLEPALAWDFVSAKGLLLGASTGPALMYRSEATTVTSDPASFEFAPSAALRIGWSQTWSRVGRRLFVFLEPKVRYAEGEFMPLVAVAVGSGGGR